MPIAKKGTGGHVDPGTYRVKVNSIDETETKFGKGFKVIFGITEGEKKGTTLMDTHPVEFTSSNKLGRLMKALGYDPEKHEEFNLNKLLDEILSIVVEDKATDRGTFSRIKDFYGKDVKAVIETEGKGK